MTTPRFAEIAIPVPLRQTFTYRIPEELAGSIRPGVQVSVPFGRRSAEGFVVALNAEPPRADLKEIRAIRSATGDALEVPLDLLDLTRWLADYYLCSWGEALKAALPGGLDAERAPNARTRRAKPTAAAETAAAPPVGRHVPRLSADQERVLGEILPAIDAREHKVFLLFGVTGSGKTEIYLRAAARVREEGGQSLILVPEIALSPQMVERFAARFGDEVVVWHSALPAGKRRDAWRRVMGGTARIVIGARSAVFAPFRDLRFIVVDEEHEPAFKQDETPRYHGRDVAIVRAHRLGIPVILGSATPSLESYHHSESGKYRRLELPRRIDDRPTPGVTVIPLVRPGEQENDDPVSQRSPVRHESTILSPPLVQALRERLRRAEQSILFLNRRGHSTVVRCGDCGWVARCPHCDIALTWHADRRELRCHYCAHRSRNIDVCPDCGGACFHFRGIGTQKVEAELARLVPEARLARMDSDTTRRRGSLEKLIDDFRHRRSDILLGTQMVARGLDFPGVTLVGVINADTQLNLPDFRSAERTFQLLTQVAGRAGRGDHPGDVIVQTYAAGHYAVDTARRHDFVAFYEREMEFRREVDDPPLTRMVSLLFDGADELKVIARAESLAVELSGRLGHGAAKVELLGPAPRSMSRLKGKHRWHITLKGRDHRELKRLSEEALAFPNEGKGKSAVRLAVDVDPMSLL